MINLQEVIETNKMIEQENLDVRTITMGINLLDCAGTDLKVTCEKIYKKITTLACNLVQTGEDIAKEFGIPIVNKRISVTPISLVGSACCRTPGDYVQIAKTLDRAAKEVGVNFLGGYSAIVSKGMTKSDELLICSIPKALAATERICSSINVGSTKTGINMDAVRLMGDIIKQTAEETKEKDSLGCAKLVVLCNAPDDNPFMAGAFHGVSEADAIINVGVSGPGVVKYALEQMDKAAAKTSRLSPLTPHLGWPILSFFVRRSSARPLRLPVWVSSSHKRQAAVWVFLSASSTSALHLPQPLAILLPTSSSASVWSILVRQVRPLPLPSSMTK